MAFFVVRRVRQLYDSCVGVSSRDRLYKICQDVLDGTYIRKQLSIKSKGRYTYVTPYTLFVWREKGEPRIVVFKKGTATFYTSAAITKLKQEHGIDVDVSTDSTTTTSSTNKKFKLPDQPIHIYIFTHIRRFAPEITYRIVMSGNMSIFNENFRDSLLTGSYQKWGVRLIPVPRDLSQELLYVDVFGTQNFISKNDCLSYRWAHQ